MKTHSLVMLCLGLALSCTTWAKDYVAKSPDGRLAVTVHAGTGTTSFQVSHAGHLLLNSSQVGMNLADGRYIGSHAVVGTHTRKVRETIPVVAGKNTTLADCYNELTLDYDGGYQLLFRVYNEGCAYRFITNLSGEVTVKAEVAQFNFAYKPKVYFPECDADERDERDQAGVLHKVHQGYRNFERLYKLYNSPADIPDGHFSVSPALFEWVGTDYKVVLTESDTYDYPGLYLESAGGNSVRGKWAAYPKEKLDSDPNNPNRMYSTHLVASREDFIAHTTGTRTFPWRVVIVSDDDRSLLNNELVYKLAEPCRLTDTSWIVPGKSAWEWWHKAVLEGVDFPNGNKNLSLRLYKYYVDWAARNNLEYMTLDAGWKESYLKELCDYARERGVKILVWTWASCPNEYPGDWFARMHDLGVAGCKIDFFERNDQEAMTWGRKFAERLAELKMVAIFHGCPVPTGLNRTYPNILNYEAVRGAECNFWEHTITPEYHTRFPFIRSLAGPEDYTPGGLRNVTPEEFKPVDRDNTPPSNMGTRAHMLSMYVILDHWIGYLCDSPTEYDKNPELMDFLSHVPSVWDETVPLPSRLGEYILMAKRKGNEWYVGGMTNFTPRTRQVDFSFLPKGKTYRATVYKDTPTAGSHPKEMAVETIEVTRATRLDMAMTRGGGFAMRLEPIR